MVSRRGFLTGMLALGAAPAIVRAASLMPVVTPAGLIVPSGDVLLPMEIGRIDGFRFIQSQVYDAMPDELTYYAIMHQSMEQAVNEMMRTGTGFTKVLYRGEVLLRG